MFLYVDTSGESVTLQADYETWALACSRLGHRTAARIRGLIQNPEIPDAIRITVSREEAALLMAGKAR